MKLEPIIEQCVRWLEEAKAHPAIIEPTAMALATADARGVPSVRMVLLKGLDVRGFVFYTNNESRKGIELQQNPYAGLSFYWPQLNRQLRIEGAVEPVSEAEADAYFATRARESQIGAWASAQSEVMKSPDALSRRVQEIEKQYAGKPMLRPPHWGGWRVMPNRIEFWTLGAHRLHERESYARTQEGDWQKSLLYP